MRRRILDALAAAPYPLRQAVLGTAYLLTPRRLPNLLPLAALTARDLVRHGRRRPLPDPREALARPDGLCGLTGRLDVDALMAGYARGMFVMSHIGPLKWWAPRQRMVLFFDRAHVEKGTRRLLRNRRFEITFDTAFARVLEACAAPRPGHPPLTWITPPLRRLFETAHAAGHAHSVEAWQDGELVGGLFGLAVGRLFFTESQFHTARDASKVAFAVLNRHLQAWGFACNDGKHDTAYLAASGFGLVTGEEFGGIAQRFATGAPLRPGRWQPDPALLGDDWQPEESPGLAADEVLPGGSAFERMSEEARAAWRSNAW